VCRFALYMGPPITLDLLTTRPEYSIIHQSFKSRMREEPLNGDGFGLAWYVPDISNEPAQYRSIRPAWNNVNLLHLARVSRSSVILAHVRAATSGFGVTESNCHPFVHGPFAFMHNGSVGEFQKLKRPLRTELSDEAYLGIHGTTDSEHLFALFTDHMKRQGHDATANAMAEAITATIADVRRWSREFGITQRSLLNLAVTDGRCAVVSRYTTDETDGLTLYIRTGEQFVFHDGVCQMLNGEKTSRTVIVASEPLTTEPGWQEVPRNHLVLVHSDHRVDVRPMA
jgi:glutamine amidotransferase